MGTGSGSNKTGMARTKAHYVRVDGETHKRLRAVAGSHERAMGREVLLALGRMLVDWRVPDPVCGPSDGRIVGVPDVRSADLNRFREIAESSGLDLGEVEGDGVVAAADGAAGTHGAEWIYDHEILRRAVARAIMDGEEERGGVDSSEVAGVQR